MKEVRYIIRCDGPMCDKEQEYLERAGPDVRPDDDWYTLTRTGLKDAHFCKLNCLWQWSKEVVNDPSGGMGPYYAKYKKE